MNVDNNDDDEAGWRKTAAVTRQKPWTTQRMTNCGSKPPLSLQTVHIVLSVDLCGVDNV
jgi:hypothetical protein